jgi:hypothetical protein
MMTQMRSRSTDRPVLLLLEVGEFCIVHSLVGLQGNEVMVHKILYTN